MKGHDKMSNEVKLNGAQIFMGREIPVIEGGFGDGRKCVTDKTVSEIHEIKVIHVRELINKNINRFKKGIDYIDLKKVIDQTDNNLLSNIGYTTMQIAKAKSIYLLSERGYSKVIKIMDTDKAWEVHDHLMDEYFVMREVIQNTYNEAQLAILKIIEAKNDLEKAEAICHYNAVVVKPLEDTIEKQKPMVGLAEMRIDKKGCYSLTDVTKSLHLKRGQITKWAKLNGYIHKTLQEVNCKGEEFFKVYSTDGIHNQIGITDNGLEYINNHIDEIVNKSA